MNVPKQNWLISHRHMHLPNGVNTLGYQIL